MNNADKIKAMKEKFDRKAVIADIIETHKIRTQEELVALLETKGICVTQATLSRDLKELGTVKVPDGNGAPYYRISYSTPMHRNLNVDSIDISGQLCVLKLQPGFASAVASIIDNAKIKGVMGSIAGDDTVLVMLKEDADTGFVSRTIKSMFNIIDIIIRVATAKDTKYASEICDEMYISSQERKTGIARRTPEYVSEKMLAGKAVIAVTEEGDFAGFSYIESWGGKSFVANSGLIVAHKFRGMGIAKRIKERIFDLSRELFPDAKIFSITTGAAVMKMNYELGFRPVPFSELTDDPEFWKGCEACRHFEILKSHDYKMCICTGLLYDPKDHVL